MVRLRLAAWAAFLTFDRAAFRCFSVAMAPLDFSICNKCESPLQKAGATTSLGLNAEFFDMGQQIAGIVVDAIRAGPFQLFLRVTAA